MKTNPLPIQGSLGPLRLLAFLPVILYFFSFFYFGINAPQCDDFQSVLRSTVLFDEATNFFEWLIAQYGEHRIAYNRVVALLVQRLTGSIDFIWMGLIGNLSLLGVFGLLLAWFKRWGIERYFLPVPFILFQMHYHHNTFIAMMGLQNLTILFWALLTFWWIDDGRSWRPWAALLIAVIAIFTSGNGMLILFTAMLMLALQRRWGLLLGWILVGGLALAGYFWQLHTLRSNYSLPFLITNLPQLTAFCIFFCGSYFDMLPNVLRSSVGTNESAYSAIFFYLRLLFPFLLGTALVLGGFLFVLRWGLNGLPIVKWPKTRLARWMERSFRYHQAANVFLAACILFILLTASLVAVGRIDTSLSQSFAIRYKIYSPLLFILAYAALLINLRQESRRITLYRILLPLSLVVGANSYYQHLNQIQDNRRTAFSGLYNTQVNKMWTVYGTYYGDIDSVLQLSINKGMYRIDTTALRRFSTLKTDLQKAYPIISTQLDTTDLYALIQVPRSKLALSLATPNESDGAYFVLYNQEKLFLMSAHIDRNAFGKYESGFRCQFERNSIKNASGFYRIAVINCRNGQPQLFNTIHQLRLTGS